MAYEKKSLRLTRIICVLGIPIVWLVAGSNIFYQYANLKRTTGSAGDTSLTQLLELNGMLADILPVNSMLVQNIVVNAGIVIGVALLATALLAIAIASIDMRNMAAMKRRRRE